MNTKISFEELSQQEITILSAKAKVISIPLIVPMRLPFGEIDERPSGVIEIKTQILGKEVNGFGEGATLPKPLFTDDSGETIFQAGNHLLRSLVGKTASINQLINEIQSFQFKDGKRFPTARMMVEMAIIDALGKSFNLSAAEIFSVSETMTEVPFGKSIGGGNFEETLLEAENSINTGSKKIKLKVIPSTVETIINVIKELRSCHPDLELMVDANGKFDPNEPNHLELIRALDNLNLLMIEEPVSKDGQVQGIEAVRRLRERLPEIKTPICLDDCLVDLSTTEAALTENLADIVNIKPGRIGSIIKSIEVAKRCKELGKQIMVGGMLEATPGRCMTTTLAALFLSMGFTIPGDLSLAQERLAVDLVPEERQLQTGPNGGILLPKGPGWGFGIIEFKK